MVDHLTIGRRLTTINRMTSTEGAPTGAGTDAAYTVRETARALKAIHRTPTPVICAKLHLSRATWFARLKGESPFTVSEVAEMSKLWGVRISDLFEGRVVVPGHRGPESRRNEDGSSAIQSFNAWRRTRNVPLLHAVPDMPGQIGAISSPKRGNLRLISTGKDQVNDVTTDNELLGIA